MLEKIRSFLAIAVGEKDVEDYIKSDYWVEFPTRSLGKILQEYEAAVKQIQLRENEELRAENELLRAALSDCMGYVDVDNLTMQTKYKQWRDALGFE